tara:strand:- start:542 stop:1507 length:966 start_codon:yes stop_codon:yes gene_type:complete
MSEFIHYKYKPRDLQFIDYNSNLKNYLYQFSKTQNIQNIVLYGPSGTGKKTFINCFLNQYFNNDNTIYTTNSFTYTLSNNYKMSYKSSMKHYQIKLLDNYKNNILIIHELLDYLIQSKSIVNKYTIIILYNIERLEHNLNLLKIIMEKYYNVRFLCTSSRRFSELELAIQLRVEKISEFHLLKICLNINKKEKLNLSHERIIELVKTSQNNINTLLNSLQSIINNTEDNLTILNDLCTILCKKNIRDYPVVKQLLNKIIIFKSYNINAIIDYIFYKLEYLIVDKHQFVSVVNNILSTRNTNIVNDIILLDTFIFYIYKIFK